nr:TPA_asm: P overlapped [Chelidonium alphacytorhabdovirus 1]
MNESIQKLIWLIFDHSAQALWQTLVMTLRWILTNWEILLLALLCLILWILISWMVRILSVPFKIYRRLRRM